MIDTSAPGSHGFGGASRRRFALALSLVVVVHLALIWLLDEPSAWRARDGARTQAPRRVTLRLIVPPAPKVTPRTADSTPLPARAPSRSTTRTPSPPIERYLGTPVAGRADDAARVTPIDTANPAEPAASSPIALPSLLDTDATRRAIRASAREPSLTEQVARSSGEPPRAGAQERLGSAVKAAGRGDCAKGDYAGAGMGLLSLPFLAAAVAGGQCAK